MYEGDYKAYIAPSPATGTGSSLYGRLGEWMGSMMEYASKTTDLMICPSVTGPVTTGAAPVGVGPNGTGGSASLSFITSLDATATVYPAQTSLTCSYSYNGWLYPAGSGDGAAQPSWYFKDDASVTTPTLTPMFTDGPWKDGWPSETDGPAKDLYWGNLTSGIGKEMGRFTILRHGGKTARGSVTITTAAQLNSQQSGGIDVAFADGHAEFTKLPNLWNYSWHHNWSPSTVTINTPQ